MQQDKFNFNIVLVFISGVLMSIAISLNASKLSATDALFCLSIVFMTLAFVLECKKASDKLKESEKKPGDRESLARETTLTD